MGTRSAFHCVLAPMIQRPTSWFAQGLSPEPAREVADGVRS
jgi:hypothetical protein